MFESLDDRKKRKPFGYHSSLQVELGLQPIITLIDSDLPVRDAEQPVFSSDEIVITLHDEGEQGRIFKMKACNSGNFCELFYSEIDGDLVFTYWLWS